MPTPDDWHDDPAVRRARAAARVAAIREANRKRAANADWQGEAIAAARRAKAAEDDVADIDRARPRPPKRDLGPPGRLADDLYDTYSG